MSPSTPLISPDALDREAAALYESATWQRIVTDWTSAPTAVPEPGTTPAPDPGPTPVVPAAPGAAPDAERWRRLLTVPVDRLVADALDALPPPLPVERRLPGRLGAVLPDRLHTWRRIGQPELRPSVHLGYARLVLTEWGWQNAPYKLRDARGARCVCGALLAAHRLGYGGATTMNEAAAWIMTELRSRGWHELIGPWNRAPGRTAADAVDLLDATIHRAALAGR
ncbi:MULTISPECIES: hypothetical protein [unclassified Streptomyces]|uniref:DUF6197 family protein n=1 Tax=unclassified Streptomyces TaxID=2593676 RepID=UPI0006F46A96|nr:MULTISPECIES: hypothetical protein [unclassified Streptomyces]KQX46170.1 hypothetical protein ASD33_22785 [Streptomyces sp. Root1304]KRA80955.1 hypothetical protein ASE09_15885 [Streptomyces sp. Root66D1]